MQIVDKPKLRGHELKRLILLNICTCRDPITPKNLLFILRITHEVIERTFYYKVKELLEEGEIIKIANLKQPNTVFYFRS
jgi:hypothetical protein